MDDDGNSNQADFIRSEEFEVDFSLVIADGHWRKQEYKKVL